MEAVQAAAPEQRSKRLVWSLAVALVVAPAVPLIWTALAGDHGSELYTGVDSPWHLSIYFEDASTTVAVLLSLVFSPAAAGVLTYATFVAATPRTLPRRTVAALLLAATAWALVLVIAYAVVRR